MMSFFCEGCEACGVKKRSVLLTVIFALLFLNSSALFAEENDWPDEVSLEYVLSQTIVEHPQLIIAATKIEEQRALLREADATTGLQSALSARFRWIDPPGISTDQSQDDHKLSLFLDKTLYDFGRSSSSVTARQAAVLSTEQRYKDAKNQYRITVLAAYFDVVQIGRAHV